MSDRTQRIAKWMAAGLAVLSMAACSTARMEDGGIVGTGNRIDCEAYARKGGTPDSVPEECKRENRK
jgi:hypothetical protein